MKIVARVTPKSFCKEYDKIRKEWSGHCFRGNNNLLGYTLKDVEIWISKLSQKEIYEKFTQLQNMIKI